MRTGEEQAKIETITLLSKCARMGLLPMEGATLDDVLGLNTETMLNRRLQTMVFSKGLAVTPKQARQFIVHGHVWIEDRQVTIPGYMVKRGEEEKIAHNGAPPSPTSCTLCVWPNRSPEAGAPREVVETRRDDDRNPKKKVVRKLDRPL